MDGQQINKSKTKKKKFTGSGGATSRRVCGSFWSRGPATLGQDQEYIEQELALRYSCFSGLLLAYFLELKHREREGYGAAWFVCVADTKCCIPHSQDARK